MLADNRIFALLLIVMSVVSCQMNGDFWWLNNDIIKLKHGIVPTPKFDEVNELDTDESAKIIFRDNVDSAKNETRSYLENNITSLKNDMETENAIYFRDETNLVKPFNKIDGVNVSTKLLGEPSNNISTENTNLSRNNAQDEFRFVFPSNNNLIWKESENVYKKNVKISSDNKTEPFTRMNSLQNISNKKQSQNKHSFAAASICTFIQKSECIRIEGTVYTPWVSAHLEETISANDVICCILPITTTPYAKIIFPDADWYPKRIRRSNLNDANTALQQRNTLMRRKQNSYNRRMKTTMPPTDKIDTHKIVNSDEYSVDPYWNIKNPIIRNPDRPIYQNPDSGYDDESKSYSDDYAEELPKPGLIGLYSDHKQTSWTYNKNNAYSYDTSDSVEEESESSLGYSNIDPRLDYRLTSKPFRHRPSRLTATASKDSINTPHTQKISFFSNPDFQVLQGFKLLNFVQHRNQRVRNTAEIDQECNKNELKRKEKPAKYVHHLHNSFEDDLSEVDLKQKLINECHKTYQVVDDCEKGKDGGIVKFGAHPWIAMVVSTNSQQDILCYATLVHARAAVTSADCVYGKSSGAISIIAGVRNLDKDHAKSQRRMATVSLDQDYKPGDLGKNLALLHWKRSLLLDATVQPSCLADLHDINDCVFIGWGGYDQEIRSDLRWQRASILTPQNCNKQLSKLQANDAFCAVVKSRGTVTGVGGPLLCKVEGRWSAVGVAVSRDNVVVLLPPQDWVIRNMASLRIQ